MLRSRLIWISALLLGFLVNCLHFVFSCGSLGVAHLLVILLIARFKFARALFTGTAHLFFHRLRESTACLRHLECAFRLLGFFISELFLHRFQIGYVEGPSWVRLPLSEIEAFKLQGWVHKFFATAGEDVDHIVNLDALVKNTGH